MQTVMKCLVRNNGEVIETSEEYIYTLIDACNKIRGQRYVTLKEALTDLGCTVILKDMDKCGWRKKQKYLPEVTTMVAADIKKYKADPHAEMPLYKIDHLEIEFQNITDLNVKPLTSEEEEEGEE